MLIAASAKRTELRRTFNVVISSMKNISVLEKPGKFSHRFRKPIFQNKVPTSLNIEEMSEQLHQLFDYLLLYFLFLLLFSICFLTPEEDSVERACVQLFLAFRRIGEYISLELFYIA